MQETSSWKIKVTTDQLHADSDLAGRRAMSKVKTEFGPELSDK
jgi:hypothetical protein